MPKVPLRRRRRKPARPPGYQATFQKYLRLHGLPVDGKGSKRGLAPYRRQFRALWTHPDVRRVDVRRGALVLTTRPLRHAREPHGRPIVFQLRIPSWRWVRDDYELAYRFSDAGSYRQPRGRWHAPCFGNAGGRIGLLNGLLNRDEKHAALAFLFLEFMKQDYLRHW